MPIQNRYPTFISQCNKEMVFWVSMTKGQVKVQFYLFHAQLSIFSIFPAPTTQRDGGFFPSLPTMWLDFSSPVSLWHAYEIL